MGDELAIIQPITEIVTILARSGEEGSDAVLRQLERDQSIENVLVLIGGLRTLENSAAFAIGEALVFLRYRKNHKEVGTFFIENRDEVLFDGDGNISLSNWPDELFEFIKQRYALTLTNTKPLEVSEFLRWTAHKYERFWLLVDEKEVVVWEQTTDNPFSRQEYETYVDQIAAALGTINTGGLWKYIATVDAFPRSKRVPDAAWTFHFRVRNLIASTVIPQNLRGDERSAAVAEPAQRLAQELAKEGKATVKEVMRRQRQAKEKKQGYAWELPPPRQFYVRDPATGKTKLAISCLTNYIGEIIAVETRVIPARPVDRVSIKMVNNRLFLNEDHVATLHNMDDPSVEAAVVTLFDKMRWQVIW